MPPPQPPILEDYGDVYLFVLPFTMPSMSFLVSAVFCHILLLPFCGRSLCTDER